MMSLEDQIQTLVLSFLLGMVLMLLWGFLNRLFYRLKATLWRGMVEIAFFVAMAYAFWQFLVMVNGGVLSLYLPFAIMLGMWVYQKTYAPKVLLVYEKLFVWGRRTILNPCISTFQKGFVIIKTFLHRRWPRGKKNRPKSQLQHDADGIHRLVWRLPDSPGVRR